MEYAKGKRGIVHKETLDGREVAVKERNPRSQAPDTLRHEYTFLKELNPHGIGPEAISYREGKLTMEFVHGEMIIDYLENHGKEEVEEALKKVFHQLRTLDDLGVNKDEMTYPYKHIIIKDRKPVLIDFERARKTESPQNITQFCQFLASRRIHDILAEKGLGFDREKLFSLARAYKESYSEKDFNKLINYLGLKNGD